MVEQFAARNTLPVVITEYLKTPPTVNELEELHRQIGGDLREMVRTNEEEYDGLGLHQAASADLLQAIHANPKLLQRPIVVYRGQAVIARPPERLNDFLNDK